MIYINDNLTKFILLVLNLLIIIYLLSPLILKSFLPNKQIFPDIITGVVIIIALLVTFSILEINISNDIQNSNIKKERTIIIEKFENNEINNVDINTGDNTNDNTVDNTNTNVTDNANTSNPDIASSNENDIIELEDPISLPQSSQSSQPSNKLMDLKKTATEKYIETLCNGTPAQIEDKCKRLTKNNCKLSKCCVLLDNSKCVSGSETGPTFLTDKKNKKIVFNNYIYNSKCYGNNCK